MVPKVYPEYSSRRVLATEFQDGVRLDGPEVKALSQERRDRIAELILELYMREVFEFRQVQTDPHFGNYRVRFAPDGRNDQLVLLDFGAVRKLPKTFVADYADLALAIIQRDELESCAAAIWVGYLRIRLRDLVREFVKVSYLLLEPVAPLDPSSAPTEWMTEKGLYRWAESDLPKRVAQAAPGIAIQFKLRGAARVDLPRPEDGDFSWFRRCPAVPDARKIVLAALTKSA